MLGLPDGDTQEPAGARQEVRRDAATAATIRTRPLEEQDLRGAGTRDGGAPVHQERSTSRTRPDHPPEETVMLPFEMLDLPHDCDTDENE
jgi:hypothetical protein